MRFFKNWLSPVFLAMLSFPVLMIGTATDIGLIMVIGGTLFMIAAVYLLLSLFVLLFRKQWGKSMYTFLFILIVVVIFGLFSS